MKLGYTTILHEPRLKLGISCNEYCLSDMIYNLSTNPKAPVNGWCSASQPMLGAALGVSRQSINTMIKKLCKVDVLIKSDNGKLLKCGDTWINTVVSFNFSSKESLLLVKKVDSQESLHPVKKVDSEQSRKFTPNSKESLHNNNKDRNTNNNTLSIGQIKDLQREREELKAQLRELTEKQAKPKRKRFSPPSIEQITEHFKEKGSDQAEAEVFFNHYESNGWKVGKNKMANWKAAATNWVKRNSKTHKPRTKNLVQRYVDYLNSHIENKILRKEHKKYENLYLIAAKDETVRKVNNFKSKLDITNPTYTDCFVFDITYGTLAKRAGTKPDRRMGEFKQFYNTLSDYNKNKGILRKLFKNYLIKKFG